MRAAPPVADCLQGGHSTERGSARYAALMTQAVNVRVQVIVRYFVRVPLALLTLTIGVPLALLVLIVLTTLADVNVSTFYEQQSDYPLKRRRRGF